MATTAPAAAVSFIRSASEAASAAVTSGESTASRIAVTTGASQASPVSSRTGLPSSTWKPRADQGFRGPAMSYHLRTGGHGLTAADWSTYLSGDLFSR